MKHALKMLLIILLIIAGTTMIVWLIVELLMWIVPYALSVLVSMIHAFPGFLDVCRQSQYSHPSQFR